MGNKASRKPHTSKVGAVRNGSQAEPAPDRLEKARKRLAKLTNQDSGALVDMDSRPGSGQSNHSASRLPQHLHRLSSMAERQFHDEIDAVKEKAESIADIRYQDYEYPFENLVFEGGGAKGQVYSGCLEVLDELGIRPKRVAGASAGALCATMIAAGYTTAEMREVLEMNLEDVMIDHGCGLCSLLPNLISKFGWNPGNKFYEYMGELLKRKLGDPDVTFKQLYKKTGIELCITAVNLNMLAVEYFHPKTSPNMPVRKAARMSVSIPGLFQAVRSPNNLGIDDLYIDGGLLCNYPIHCFDGWWLSMDKENSFLNKLQPLSDLPKLMDKRTRFGVRNDKTLGFLVYSSLEQDLMQTELESRVGVELAERPAKSKLYRSRAALLKSKEEAQEEHQVFLHALDLFLRATVQTNIGNKHDIMAVEQPTAQTLKEVNQRAGKAADDVIDKEELKQAIIHAVKNVYHVEKRRARRQRSSSPDSDDEQDGEVFTEAHLEILFGRDNSLESILAELDTDGSGYISYDELMSFIERSGFDIQAKFLGYNRKELHNLKDFAVGLQDCLLTNVKRMFLEEKDVDRTVGINTDYIETTDFNMEKCDREFLVEQGRRCTISYLKNYVHHVKPPLKQQSPNAKKLPTLSESSVDVVDGLPPGRQVRGHSSQPLADVKPSRANNRLSPIDTSDQEEKAERIPSYTRLPAIGSTESTPTESLNNTATTVLDV